MESHSPAREGTLAGIIGASAVALWFLMVDSIAGRPFFTPAILGASLFDLLGGGFGGRGLATHVAAYTVVHFTTFILIGIAAAMVMNALDRRPTLLVGFVALFLVFEICVIGAVALLSRSPLFGSIAWYQLGAANLLAAYSMGRYLWRAHHPAVEERWVRALESR
jgi:hypothetical protein